MRRGWAPLAPARRCHSLILSSPVARTNKKGRLSASLFFAKNNRTRTISMQQSGGLLLAASLMAATPWFFRVEVARTISSVHNGLKLWTLDFFTLMYEQAVCLLVLDFRMKCTKTMVFSVSFRSFLVGCQGCHPGQAGLLQQIRCLLQHRTTLTCFVEQGIITEKGGE